MIFLTLKDGRAMLVNPEYVEAVVPPVKASDPGSVLMMPSGSSLQVQEDVFEVHEAMQYAWDLGETEVEAGQEGADEEIRVSGVPYAVPASSVAHTGAQGATYPWPVDDGAD